MRDTSRIDDDETKDDAPEQDAPTAAELADLPADDDDVRGGAGTAREKQEK